MPPTGAQSGRPAPVEACRNAAAAAAALTGAASAYWAVLARGGPAADRDQAGPGGRDAAIAALAEAGRLTAAVEATAGDVAASAGNVAAIDVAAAAARAAAAAVLGDALRAAARAGMSRAYGEELDAARDGVVRGLAGLAEALAVAARAIARSVPPAGQNIAQSTIRPIVGPLTAALAASAPGGAEAVLDAAAGAAAGLSPRGPPAGRLPEDLGVTPAGWAPTQPDYDYDIDVFVSRGIAPPLTAGLTVELARRLNRAIRPAAPSGPLPAGHAAQRGEGIGQGPVPPVEPSQPRARAYAVPAAAWEAAAAGGRLGDTSAACELWDARQEEPGPEGAAAAALTPQAVAATVAQALARAWEGPDRPATLAALVADGVGPARAAVEQALYEAASDAMLATALWRAGPQAGAAAARQLREDLALRAAAAAARHARAALRAVAADSAAGDRAAGAAATLLVERVCDRALAGRRAAGRRDGPAWTFGSPFPLIPPAAFSRIRGIATRPLAPGELPPGLRPAAAGGLGGREGAG
jgi:hypothetical protein